MYSCSRRIRSYLQNNLLIFINDILQRPVLIINLTVEQELHLPNFLNLVVLLNYILHWIWSWLKKCWCWWNNKTSDELRLQYYNDRNVSSGIVIFTLCNWYSVYWNATKDIILMIPLLYWGSNDENQLAKLLVTEVSTDVDEISGRQIIFNYINWIFLFKRN